MKFIKRSLIIILILTTVGILFRGMFYRHIVTYKSVGLRTNYSAKDKKLTDYIESSIDNKDNTDINQICSLVIKSTVSKQLISGETV